MWEAKDFQIQILAPPPPASFPRRQTGTPCSFLVHLWLHDGHMISVIMFRLIGVWSQTFDVLMRM